MHKCSFNNSKYRLKTTLVKYFGSWKIEMKTLALTGKLKHEQKTNLI